MTNTDAAAASPTTTTAAASPTTTTATAAPATDNTATTAATAAAPTTDTATAAKFSISAMADTIVKIITALVIAKCWYIGWAFRWVVETPLSCLAKTLLIMFFTALALHTRRMYPQVILGLIWFIIFFPYSIFADKITFTDSANTVLLCTFVLLLSVPVMLNVLYRGMNDINNIRRSAFDFRTPRRDALLPYFCLIALLIIFLFFLTNFASISGFMPKTIWRCLFFGLSALCLLPLPAAFSRRLKAWHAAAPTPPEAQNCKADTPQKTTQFPFWHKYQPCFRLTIVILCIFAMLKSGLTLLIPCLIIGVCEEFILLYKLRKTILPPQTPTAKQPFGNPSANNIAQPAPAIPASVNSIHRIAPQNFNTQNTRSSQNINARNTRTPPFPAQQSLLQKQRRARCRNFFLHAVGIIILLLLFTSLSVGITNYGGGNINTAERRFGKITSDEQRLHDRYYF